MLSIGLLLLGVGLTVVHGAAFAGTCPAILKVVRPIAGAEVGLHEEVEVTVTGRPLKVAVFVRAAHKEWWVQGNSAAPEDGKVVVVAQFGERGIGIGEIYEIVALVDADGRYRRGDRFDRLPDAPCGSNFGRVRKTHD